ncbi:CDP-diacylglycerol--serine O-phosphatidyltransferase [Bacteroidales bacterium OttesenSCG-928-M11]|nr:CDP-diacylglycerol--serine O-phosphatidyltransferase [Bacteroidales bacterium OttesenSCG-928-M11]
MKHIPNMITLLNLFAGCMACIMILRFNSYTGALVFICMAGLFDFLDGFAARLLKAYSKLGEQLDSLADAVSFGAAPGFIVYSFLNESSQGTPLANKVAFLGLLIPIFSVVRLAKFNIDTRQTNSFLGLPVPACAIFWASFIPALYNQNIIGTTVSLIVSTLIIIFSLLMVSEIPMFSLKFKNTSWKDNKWPFSFIGLTVITLIITYTLGLFFWGISSIIALYIIMSLIKSISK